MKALKTMTADALEALIDFRVVDKEGQSIGSLHSLWSDPTTGAVEFLGIKTGWLFGHNHVTPADKAELDDANSVVRVPYSEAFIKQAPSFSADAEITEAEEDKIYQYFGATSAQTVDEDSQIGGDALSAARALSESMAASGPERWRRVSSSTAVEPAPGANLDPVSGEAGAHPAGVGLGAAGGGLSGAAIGAAVGGPIGGVVGAVAGAIGGGLAGKGVAETVDPTAEDAYWRENFRGAPYYRPDFAYEDYSPGYQAGYEGYRQLGGGSFEQHESELGRRYAGARPWEDVRDAARDAWERLEKRFR